MKKKVVFRKEEENVINIEDVNDSHIIGLEGIDWDKMIPVKVKDGVYIAVTPNTSNDSHSGYVEFSSTKDILNDIFTRQAFVFDTFKERAEWLMQGMEEEN